MKIAMMSYTMARGEWGQEADVAALCRLTRELGLDGIDWVTTYGKPAAEIKLIMDDFGLKTVAHTFFAGIQSPDPQARKAALDEVKIGLDTAAALGTDIVMIPLPGVPDVPREETRKNAIAGLAEAVALGAAMGITITTEDFPGAGSAFITSADMLEGLAAVPGLKITYDNGNVLTGGEDPAQAFRNIAEHVVHAHFKDFELVDEGMVGLDGRNYRGALIGEGLVHPLPCLQAMHECGYEGYINFEYEGNLYTPEESMRRGVPPLLEAIATLEQA